VPFDPIKDFHPVALIASFPVIYTVRPELGVRTLEQLIAYAKQKPGVLNYSTPGAGTLPHLATELLKLNTGIDMVHIPYPGGGPAAQALLSNTVHVAAISITAAKPQIDAGNMVGLAVTGYERWPELPNIPTIAEAGVPAAQADAWQGIMVPAGTPRSVVDHLAKVLIGIMRQPGVREKLLHAGFDSTAFGPDESLKRVVEEVPRWKEVIERARITVR
jgi:tripartite-type tricarboxylate transporter receptor subunit TctC